MHYYIDGYNLLFRILRAGEDVRKQREELTREIGKKVELLEIDATLVFDSHYQPDDNTRSHLNNLEIVFTAKDESADAYILQELKEARDPPQHTVVTSDKPLARLCRLRLAKTETVDEFLAWIGKRYKNKLRQKQNPEPLERLAPLPKPPPVRVKPDTRNEEEKSFDSYLNIFEKMSSEMEEQTPKKKSEPVPKKAKLKKLKRKLTKEEEYLSDFQRWQNIFESE